MAPRVWTGNWMDGWLAGYAFLPRSHGAWGRKQILGENMLNCWHLETSILAKNSINSKKACWVRNKGRGVISCRAWRKEPGRATPGK